MSRRRTYSLNLASRPVRNRRYYLTLRTTLLILLVGLVGLSAFFLRSFGTRRNSLKMSLAEVREKFRSAEAETEKLSAAIEKEEASSSGQIELVNSIIYRKSFSWTGFLTQIEGSLPNSSYITSFSPNILDDTTIGLRFKVVSRNLDDLLVLINNLAVRDFSGIRVDNEVRNERGQLVSEIALTYERTF